MYNSLFPEGRMHELSIAQNIVDIVGQYVPTAQIPSVRLIRIRIGPLAGIVADSLDFCFGAIVGGTPLSASKLDIEQTPLESNCNHCAKRFAVEGAAFYCPGCGSTDIKVVSGTELQVVEIELADRQGEGS
jgi:hydrogenase nickel incorporation protein HypA/HybF